MRLLNFLKRNPRSKQCGRRGKSARVLRGCGIECQRRRFLVPRMPDPDYAQFLGLTLVIAPASGFPGYVFRDLNHLRANSPQAAERCVHNCKTLEFARAALLKLDAFGSPKGLTTANFSGVLVKGVQETLVRWGGPARKVSMRRLHGNSSLQQAS